MRARGKIAIRCNQPGFQVMFYTLGSGKPLRVLFDTFAEAIRFTDKLRRRWVNE